MPLLDVTPSPHGAYIGTFETSARGGGHLYANYSEDGPGPLVLPLTEGRGSKKLTVRPEHEHWLFVATVCTGGGHVSLGSGSGRHPFMIIGPCDGTTIVNRYVGSAVSLAGGWQLRAPAGTYWQMAAVASGNAQSGQQMVTVGGSTG